MVAGEAGLDDGIYRAFFESSADGMILCGSDSCIVDVNDAAMRMLGCDGTSLRGRHLNELFDTVDERFVSARKTLESCGHFDGNLLVARPDGTTFIADVSLRIRETGVSVVFREEDELRFRTLANVTPDLVAFVRNDTTIEYVSPSVEQTCGFMPEEVVGHKLLEFVHPKDLPEAERVFARTEENSGTLEPLSLLFRIRHRDGSWRKVEALASDHSDRTDAGTMILDCRDVTERVRVEEELQKSEERFRALVENVHDFVALASAENVALYANPSIERIMGYTPEEFVGTFIGQYIHPDDVEAGLANVAGSLALPGPRILETLRYIHKDGSSVWLEVTVNNQLDNPAVRGVICNCRDVTDRIKAEEKLRKSEERFRALIENAHDFVVLADEKNVARYASPSIEQTLGYTPEEFVGTVISGYGHPDEAEAALARIAETIPIDGPQTLGTWRYRHKDGSYRWLEVVVNSRFDDPYLRGAVCNCRDVTERVEMEEKLRQSEGFHRALSENALDFVVIQKPDNTLAYASPSVERLLGWTPEEIVGKMGADYIHPDDLEWAWPLFYEQVANPGIGITERVCIRYRHKDGRWRWFESACNNQLDDPAIGGLVFNCRDVTERVEAEEKLRDAEERYRLLVEQVPVATYIESNDADSSTVYVSPRIEEMLGYAPEEWVSTPDLWLRTIHPEDHGRVLARHLRCNESGETFDEEYRCVAKDGREVWVRDEAVLVRDGSGEPLYWQGVKADITGRKLAELEILRLNTELRGELSDYTAELKSAIRSLRDAEDHLKTREEQFLVTFERAAVGIAHVSPEGRWLRVNQKLCEVLGYGRDQLLNRTFQDITHPEDLDRDLSHVRRLLAGEEPDYTVEKRYIRGDGRIIWARLTVSLVRSSDGEPEYFISVIEDISRRRKTEELRSLLTARDMVVLSELARGKTNAEIATSLNYSVNTIKSHVRSVVEKLEVNDRTQAAVYAAEMGLFERHTVGT